MRYSYDITPRPVELGGGWRLRLLEDGDEVGGGVFPVVPDAPAGVAWWRGLSEEERAQWLRRAAQPTAADAHLAHLQDEAWHDAEGTAYEWLDSRDHV